MIHAVIRLIVITITTVTVAFIAVYGTRYLGSKQTFQPPPHEWFKKANWRILQPTPSEACDANALKPLVELWKADIVAVHVKYKDAAWVVACDKPIPLDDLLKTEVARDWLIRIDARDTPGLEELVAILSPWDSQMNFGIHSPSQKVNKFVRKKAAQWAYAADTPTLARLKFFEGIWLETAIDFWPDFVIASHDRKKPEFVDEATLTELRRRQKRIIFEENPASDVQNEDVSRFDGILGRTL